MAETITGMVSTIIPAYNAARYLPAAIESALRQTYRNHEVIVVNDGSTDDTGQVARGYRDRIVYIEQQNMGVSAARNAGVAAARGEWIAFLDADDRFLPNCLERTSAVWAAHPDVDVVAFDFWHVDVQGRQIDRCMERHAKGFGMVRWDRHDGDVAWVASYGLFAALVREFFIAPAAALVRREALVAIGGFNEAYQTAEDLDLFLRMAKAGHTFALIPEPLMAITQVPQSLCRENPSVAPNRLAVLESLRRTHALDHTESRCIRQEIAATEATMAWQAFQNKDYRVSRSFARRAFVHGDRFKGIRAYLRTFPLLRRAHISIAKKVDT